MSISITSKLVQTLLAGCLYLVLTVNSAWAQEITPRIVGGSVVPDERYPFMAAVLIDIDGDNAIDAQCGGSLIGSSWILTAAHCVVIPETGALVGGVGVYLGGLDLTQNDGEFILARSIVVHPQYNVSSYVSDIALIELSEPYSGAVIGLPPAFSDVPLANETATVAGWGAISESGPSSNLLREVDLPIVPFAECLPFYPDDLNLQANVCAGGATTVAEDSCQGDSGGPLFVVRDGLYVQAGIVSYGEGCARPSVPGVYTRVASYVDWIASFVPDIVINTSITGTQDTQNALEGSNVVSLSATNSSRENSVSAGAVDIYEITRARSVSVFSRTGDADLYVAVGTQLREEDIVCFSEEVTTLDACELPETSLPLYALVYGYTDSNYLVEAFFESPLNDDPVVPVNNPVVPANDPVNSNTGRSGGGSVGWMILSVFFLTAIFRKINHSLRSDINTGDRKALD
ncbi:MAG: serine protease [Granulosicoccus sp.]